MIAADVYGHEGYTSAKDSDFDLVHEYNKTVQNWTNKHKDSSYYNYQWCSHQVIIVTAIFLLSLFTFWSVHRLKLRI